MTKEFVPYQESLSLKELGFNEPCFGYYIELRNPSEGILSIDKCENNVDGVSAPTFSQAFRWFREAKNGSYNHLDFMYEYLKNDSVTYEEAELACLNKLIEIVKGGKQ